MRITVYCDREGILRYNPDGWPGRSEVEMSPDVLAIAKSQSIPFEDQGYIEFKVKQLTDHEGEFPTPDYFQNIEIDGVIEIADQICRIIPMYKQLSYKEQEYKEMIDTIKLLSTAEGIEYLKKILS